MLTKLIQAFSLLALTVAFHAIVLAAVLYRVERYRETPIASFLVYTGLLVCVAAAIVLAHIVEVSIWALFYVWSGAMPDLTQGLYFSAATYATVGYGDVVPPPDWRLIAAAEGLTGILMCAWSGGFFFAVVTATWAPRRILRPPHENGG